jgi:hypothetical protein
MSKEIDNYSGGYADNDNTVIVGQGSNVCVRDTAQRVLSPEQPPTQKG